MEAICQKNRTSKEMILYGLGQFRLHAIASATTYNSYGDFASHYTNWLTINVSKLQPPKKAQPKPQEQAISVNPDEIMKKACLWALDIVRTGKWYNDPGNSCYSYLERKGLLKFTATQKNEFMAKAKDDIRAKINKPVTMDENRRVKSLLAELEITNTPEAVVLAKKIAVNNFLKNMIEFDIKFEFK